MFRHRGFSSTSIFGMTVNKKTQTKKTAEKKVATKKAAPKKAAAKKSPAKKVSSKKDVYENEDTSFIDREKIAELVSSFEDVVDREKLDSSVQQASAIVKETAQSIDKKISFFKKIFGGRLK